MSDTGPTPPPTGTEGDSEPHAASQTPFCCAMPEAIPPRERCDAQCAHCRHQERRQTRVLPWEDEGEPSWALVDHDGNVLSTHNDRVDATIAFERYLLDVPSN